jgi:hypothetical protein
MRVGNSGFALTRLCLPLFILGVANRLIGNRIQLNAKWLIFLCVFCAAIVVLQKATGLKRRMAHWRAIVEARPIPRLTLARVVVVLGVGAIVGYLFLNVLSISALYDPQFILLVGALIISFNTLENLWVANDERRDQAPHDAGKRFA